MREAGRKSGCRVSYVKVPVTQKSLEMIPSKPSRI